MRSGQPSRTARGAAAHRAVHQMLEGGATGGTGGNVGFGEALLVDFLARRDRSPRRTAEGRRIEIIEVLGQRRDHRRAQHMCDVAHDRVGAPAFDEGVQLGLDICLLQIKALACETIER